MKLLTNYLFYFGIFLFNHFEFTLAANNDNYWYHHYLPKFLKLPDNNSNNNDNNNNNNNKDNFQQLSSINDNEYLSGLIFLSLFSFKSIVIKFVNVRVRVYVCTCI